MIQDKIRGSLIAGAAGDALGYEVEFMSRKSIIARYGEPGITRFELTENGKALISDDTQMTLFTANGLLNAAHGQPEPIDAIIRAYVDWYHTQTGNRESAKSCRISNIDELYSLRAPGNTCMSALSAIAKGRSVHNNSKGCGGIMRIAPIPLYAAVCNDFDEIKVARLAGDASECTHRNPLGFLPSALMAVLLYRILPLTANQAKEEIERIVIDALAVLDVAYKNKYASEKSYLNDLTQMAIRLAHSDMAETDAIRHLGEGWVGDEAWAIALYCALRHIDSVEDAIIASVNHDGDSDSTGSVCGNIMGAIYGYEHIESRNIFCPEGKTLGETLELSDVILELADELSEGRQS